jgi:hypothetical protein
MLDFLEVVVQRRPPDGQGDDPLGLDALDATAADHASRVAGF